MRALMLTLFLLSTCLLIHAQQDEPPPYDEWAESPTIFLEGCGRFPAVRVTVDSRELEQRGFIRMRRTHLPARETLEQLGGRVIWVQAQRAFYGQFPQQRVTLRVNVGSRTIQVYRYDPDAQYGAGPLRETMNLDSAPIHCEGRVFAPIRRAVESVGGIVHFDGRTRTVQVTTPPGARGRVGEVLQ